MLTRYGKLFLPYVEESLKVLAEGVQRTRELNGSKEGIIHLAYIYTMGSNFTPKMVRNFLDAYPDYHIDFHFTVGTTGDILAGLKEDKYDIVFSSYQEGEPDIEFRKIGNQKLVVAVPQDHPLAIHGSVDLRDTIAYPQIYFEKGSGLRTVRQSQISISSRRLPLRWRRTPVWQDWSHRASESQSCRISQS